MVDRQDQRARIIAMFDLNTISKQRIVAQDAESLRRMVLIHLVKILLKVQ